MQPTTYSAADPHYTVKKKRAIMERAEELFNKILAEGEIAIDNFILSRKAEELFLDFKRSSIMVLEISLARLIEIIWLKLFQDLVILKAE